MAGEIQVDSDVGGKSRPSPRGLLLFSKIGILLIAIYFATESSGTPYFNFNRIIAGLTLICLLPLFGWTVPLTVLGIVIAMVPPRTINWTPLDNLYLLIGLPILGFGIGYLADRAHHKRLTHNYRGE